MKIKHKNQTTVFILGTIPPPMGGISVFCLRRINQLSKNGIKTILFDTKSKFSIVQIWLFSILYRLKKREFIIEINTSNPLAIFFLYLLGLLPYSIFIDHNSSRRFTGKFKQAQLRHIAKSCQEIKLVNPDLIDNYKKADIQSFDNFLNFSPYIRPTKKEIEDAYQTHYAVLNPLISERSKNIVLSSAWKPVLHTDGKDLYGIENTLQIYHELLPLYPDIQFVFLIGEVDHSTLCTVAQETAHRLGKQFKNFHFLTGGIPQWPLLENTLVLLRLTRTDGDSVSIREALDFGSEVIATDVCSRPSGVRLTSLDNNQQACDLLKSILKTQLQ